MNKKSILIQASIILISLILSIVISLGLSYLINLNTNKVGKIEWNNQTWMSFGLLFAGLLLFLELLLWHYKDVVFKNKKTGTIDTRENKKEQQKILKEYSKLKQNELVLLDNKNGFPISGLTTHTAIVGKTGVGKTKTILKIISELEKKDPNSINIIIDGKGDPGLIKEFANEETFIWTMNGTNSWNPIESNNESIIVDKISTFFNTNNDYFKERGIRYLDNIIKFLKLNKEQITIPNIFKYVDYDVFRKAKETHKKEHSFDLTENEKRVSREIYSFLMNLDKDHITGISDTLYNLYDPVREVLNDENTLLEITKKYKRIIFSLNSLQNSMRAGILGRLLVQDLKEFATIKDPNLTINIFLDELNVFISNDLVNLINKSRSYNFRCFLAFQTIGDLKVEHSNQDLSDIIFGNISNVIIHEAPSPNSKEFFAKLLGTKKVLEKTSQFDHKTGFGYRGNKKEIDEFIVHPSELMKLKKGECYIKIPLDSGLKMIKKIKVIMA